MPSIHASAEDEGAQAPLLSLTGLSVGFDTRSRRVMAAAGITLSVRRGECLGVLGESGAGKTQVFLAVMGLLGPGGFATGSVRFAGQELLGQRAAALDRLRGAGDRHGVPGPDDLAHAAPAGRRAAGGGAAAASCD